LVGYILAFVAAVFASANVVGGYVVTERMLKMFRRKAPAEVTPADTGSLNTGALNTGALNRAKGLKGLLSRAGKAEQQ
jgi:NAD(P) transhydrogenase subunit alpha